MAWPASDQDRRPPFSAPPEFSERLAVTLALTIGGTKISLFGASVKRLELTLRSYGFTGELEFTVLDDKAASGKYEDKLLKEFQKPDPITIELSLRRTRTDDKLDTSLPPLKVVGQVTERAYRDFHYREVKGALPLARRYFVRFADAASHLLGQHYPCVLYTKKTLKQVIEAQKPDAVKLSLTWPFLTEQRPQIFLSHQPHLESGIPTASFYDFLIWLVDVNGGVLAYDYLKQELLFAKEKPSAARKVKLLAADVAALTVHPAEQRRYKVRILNSYTEQPATQEVAHEPAQTPLSQDYLLATPVSAHLDEKKSLEGLRLFREEPQLTIDYERFPGNPLLPGDLIKLDPPETFAARQRTVPAALKDKTLRIVRIALSAEAVDQGPDVNVGLDESAFRCRMSLRAELEAEKRVELPRYVAPIYPRHVEGKIVSEVGEDVEQTYQIYTEEKNSLEQYQIKIPLWDNQIVAAPFVPNFFPGHFYLPVYRNERVLVALYFDRARIDRYLDWRPDARLAAETQGNHLILGRKTVTGTAMSHAYTEDKPVFTIKRTNEKDLQTIEVKEGTLTIEVKEQS